MAAGSLQFPFNQAGRSDDTMRQHRVDVSLPDFTYSVRIGQGMRHYLPGLVSELGARKVAVVISRPLNSLPALEAETLVVPFKDGEINKNLKSVERLCRKFAQFGLTREDLIIACGGGTTTDTVGLAAALYHRGTPVVHVPTTLLAQVDGSIGGKTAVNLPDGKNLVGAYWQPHAVLCDTDFLSTLPKRELSNGYGEIARCHFIGAGDLRGLSVEQQIVASVSLKAALVGADERDAGRRNLLNYGHTLGHAIERSTGYSVKHGEAVAIGTVFAGRLAGLLGRIDQKRVKEHSEVVTSYGLPICLPTGAEIKEIVSLMRLDKKARSDLTFVLDGPNGAELVRGVPESAVIEVLREMI